MIKSENDKVKNVEIKKRRLISLEEYYKAWRTEFPDLTYLEFEELLKELEKIGHVTFVNKKLE